VIDVGATYEPEKHRYDHHQREFNEVFGHGFGCTKLSSAGEPETDRRSAPQLAVKQPPHSATISLVHAHRACVQALWQGGHLQPARSKS
jgi:hypothetical protein